MATTWPPHGPHNLSKNKEHIFLSGGRNKMPRRDIDK